MTWILIVYLFHLFFYWLFFILKLCVKIGRNHILMNIFILIQMGLICLRRSFFAHSCFAFICWKFKKNGITYHFTCLCKKSCCICITDQTCSWFRMMRSSSLEWYHLHQPWLRMWAVRCDSSTSRRSVQFDRLTTMCSEIVSYVIVTCKVKVKVAHTWLLSLGFRGWSGFLAVSLQLPSRPIGRY